jgi:hypothetical protein
MNWARAVRVQWPVGKGGFSTGKIECDGGAFNYIYDCGATSPKRLSTIIDFYKRGTSAADLLFISHLDSDHVNGVEALAKALDIRAIVMPYLSRLDVLVLVSAALNAGTLTESHADALTDTAAWLRRHGIRRAIYVGNSEFRDGEPASQTAPFDGEPMPNGWQTDHETEGPWSVTFDTSPILRLPPVDERPEEYWINGHTNIRANISGTAVWQFIPFVPKFDDASIQNFERQIQKIEEEDRVDLQDPETLKDYIQSVNNRGKLKKCYKALSSDRNKTCLCLGTAWGAGARYVDTRIARSAPPPIAAGLCYGSYWPYIDTYAGSVWLHTGDLHLQEGAVLNDYVNQYKAIMNRLRVFQLPHHGSHRSFDARAMDLVSPHLVFATVNESSKHHPHPDVVDLVTLGGAGFCRITREGDTVLREDSWCEIAEGRRPGVE